MKKNKVIGNTNIESNSTTPSCRNEFLQDLFVGYPTKVQNDPSFKALTHGAQALLSEIERLVPPGQGQAEALGGVISSTRAAIGVMANAITLPSAV